MADVDVADIEATEHTYKFDIKMTCAGCSGAVTRVLKKAEAEGLVTSYSVKLEEQEVTVRGLIPYSDLFARLEKTGKEIRSGTTFE